MNKDNKILAWYFAPKGNKLRYGDGRLVRAGTTHTIKGQPRTCFNGLHASINIMDALSYASTPIVYRVELFGNIYIYCFR